MKKRKFSPNKNNKYSKDQEPIATLDLHGMTRFEALDAFNGFMNEYYDNKEATSVKKRTFVRVITGKGSHSIDGVGVLRNVIIHALTVNGLDYKPAKLKDGGEGVIEVRLR